MADDRETRFEGAVISEELCESRRALMDEKLARIQSDTKSTRQGIGKLLRIVTESNGKPSLIAQVGKNNEFRENVAELELIEVVKSNKAFREAMLSARSERKTRQWGMLLALAGWCVTIALWLGETFFRS